MTLKDNGEAALEELEADPSQVDLVVLDVMLPGHGRLYGRLANARARDG